VNRKVPFQTQGSTISRHPSRLPFESPLEWSEASGARLYCGAQSFVDWNQGLGAVGVLGHRYGEVVEAIEVALRRGGVAHLPHRDESEVAELLLETVPCLNPRDWTVRFAENGSDVTASAVRLARGITGKTKVIVFEGAYHGESASDWHLCAKPPALGVPEGYPRPITLPWNAPDLYSNLDFDEIAAVIFEVNIEDPTPGMVTWLNSIADRDDVFLIADEVVTGFRLARGGACEAFDIRPDLVCYGKALGNGLVPISALCGRREPMYRLNPSHPEGYVFMSYTYAGYLPGLAAARASLRSLQDATIFDFIDSVGRDLMESFDASAVQHGVVAKAVGQAERSRFVFANAGGFTGEELWRTFIRSMMERGIAMYVANFPTIFHDEALLERTRRAMSVSLSTLEQKTVKGKA